MENGTKPEGNSRILSNISSLDDALKVEETMKSGYVEAIVENIVHWIGAEEDLADSYEEFSKNLTSAEEREAASQLHVLSSSNADILRKKLEEFEGINNEYRKRILHVKRLTKRL